MKKIIMISAIIAAMLTGCSEKTNSEAENQKKDYFDYTYLGFEKQGLIPEGECEMEYFKDEENEDVSVKEIFNHYRTKQKDASLLFDEKGRFRKYIYTGDEDNPSGNLHEEELEKKCYELLEKTVPDPESYISSMGLNYGGTDATSYSANFEKFNEVGLEEVSIGVKLELDGDIRSIGVSYMDIEGIDYSEHEEWFEMRYQEKLKFLLDNYYKGWVVEESVMTQLRVVGDNLYAYYYVTLNDGKEEPAYSVETILIKRNLKED